MQKPLATVAALFAATFAYADSGKVTSTVDVSAIMNGVSTESAQHEIDANVDDWTNDIVQFTTLQSRACRDAKVESAILGSPLVPSPMLAVSAVAEFEDGNFTGVTLLPAELAQLQAIQTAPIDTDADQIQKEISIEQLAMRVSGRSYADAIESYKLRAVAEETYGKLNGVADRCNQYSYQIIRDHDMIAASQRLLALYAQADAASTAAIDQAVAEQTAPRPFYRGKFQALVLRRRCTGPKYRGHTEVDPGKTPRGRKRKVLRRRLRRWPSWRH